MKSLNFSNNWAILRKYATTKKIDFSFETCFGPSFIIWSFSKLLIYRNAPISKKSTKMSEIEKKLSTLSTFCGHFCCNVFFKICNAKLVFLLLSCLCWNLERNLSGNVQKLHQKRQNLQFFLQFRVNLRHFSFTN